MKKAITLVPVDGEFALNAPEQALWCDSKGHPQIYLNISKSTSDLEVFRCLCGKVKSERVATPKIPARPTER